jgi:hypothetical protein
MAVNFSRKKKGRGA